METAADDPIVSRNHQLQRLYLRGMRWPVRKSDGSRSTSATPSSRRDFFHWVSDGIYGAALTSLLCRDLSGELNQLNPEPDSAPRRAYDLKPRKPSQEPKAKAVIQLLMNGAPSQMDLFDPKPMLEKLQG